MITSNLNEYSPIVQNLIKKRSSSRNSGPSIHIAAFANDLKTKKSKFISIIGENSLRTRFGNTKITTHAEIDALRKLEFLIKSKKTKKKKDLIVLRINKTGKLCESAPCYHCTKELSLNCNIEVNNLYFSRTDGSISCIKFSDWVLKDNQKISKGWKWISKHS
jgi:hypothetical protein